MNSVALSVPSLIFVYIYYQIRRFHTPYFKPAGVPQGTILGAIHSVLYPIIVYIAHIINPFIASQTLQSQLSSEWCPN